MNFELNSDLSPDEAELLTDLGQALEKGTVFKKDYNAALECYITASSCGNVRALHNLAYLYENGIGVTQNYDKAIELYKMAADSGSSVSMVCIGQLYEAGYPDGNVDYKQAYYWYNKAAEAGDQHGLFKYAEFLYHGKGVRKNYKLAFVVFVTLNNSGFVGTSYFLGQYFERGIQMKKDYEKARSYYRIGALHNDRKCFRQLGKIYAEGLGVKADAKAAMDYYKRAAELGDAHSCYIIGSCFERDKTAEENIYIAINWYKTALKSGDADAKNALVRLGFTNVA